jgi:hypothetical protein
MAKAIFNFVPTPSMLATKTGSRIWENWRETIRRSRRFAQHLRAMRLSNERLNLALEPVAKIDVNARARALPLCHWFIEISEFPQRFRLVRFAAMTGSL